MSKKTIFIDDLANELLEDSIDDINKIELILTVESEPNVARQKETFTWVIAIGFLLLFAMVVLSNVFAPYWVSDMERLTQTQQGSTQTLSIMTGMVGVILGYYFRRPTPPQDKP